jgi:hypothetical protein
MQGDARFDKVSSIKSILAARATGQHGLTDDDDYVRLRGELLADTTVASDLPRFVRSNRTLGDFWSFIQPKFSTYRERRAYLTEEFDGLLTRLELGASPVEAVASAAMARLSAEEVARIWEKAVARRANDPEGAITAARTLVESVCKHILDEAAVGYPDNADLPALYGLVARELQLSPNQQSEQIFKQILGGCNSVVDGLAGLRNRLSDAHGRGRANVKPASRHAGLAVNLAGALATFLLETWEARR